MRPISERPPSIKPLDFGDTSLMSKMSLHGRRKSSTTLLGSPKRISIGHPTNFRRLDYSEKQRRSLKPLQLEPVVLRGGELETIHSNSDVRLADTTSKSTDNLTDQIDRYSYREARVTPLERCHQMSAAARSETSLPATKEERTPLQETPRPTRPPLSTRSSSSSIRSLRRQALDGSASTPTSSRASFERTRLIRKRSDQRLLSNGGSKDLDKEILELNTIVEERRAEAARPHSPNEMHVPAVAPAMSVRARSETLTDIGSAFSRPLRLETNCQRIEESVSPIKHRLSRPFTNMPDPNLTSGEAGVVRRPSSRLTGWLTSVLSSSTTTLPISSPTQEPFYKCAPPVRRRAVSETSFCTTVTEMESPSLTATSSPISKSHSRTLTAESRMTPISPPSTACASEFDTRDMKRKTEHWPITDHPSQVGLAL